METAADEVVHPTEHHRVERLRGHLGLAAPQQELEHRGWRELGRVPETTPGRIELPAQHGDGIREQRREQGVAGRLDRRAQALCNRARVALDVVTPIAPGLGDGGEDLREARQPVSALRRVVRPAEERLSDGVRKTVIGQPPWPVSETTASM